MLQRESRDQVDVPVVTLGETLHGADAQLRTGRGYGARVWPTGFSPLDQHLTGGLRAGELVLLAGSQGLGKTTFALQLARNVAERGQQVLYVCYEHPAEQLAERLLVLESGLASGPGAVTLEETRRALASGEGGLVDRLGGLPGVEDAWARLEAYAGVLHLMSARGDRTSLAHIAAAARSLDSPLIVVDYLQKVSLDSEQDEELTTSRVATGLKDLALDLEVPVLAVAAVERGAREGRRARVRDLKGSVTLAYEADIILVLNEKYDVVAKHHLVYDVANAERFHGWIVCSVEKNRSGENHLDLEFRKHFSQGHYDPHGQMVEEKLLDERVHVE